VFALLIVGIVVAVPVLYAADRIIKARAQARRMRTMGERLTAVTARAEKQHERRQEVARASAELTSVMPAIERPPLTLPPPRADEHETRTADQAGSAPRSPGQSPG
jgi:hypothetical protein